MYPSFNARAFGLTMPAASTIELAARAGFAGVDLLVRDLVDEGDDPTALRGRMDELGLRGGAWPLPVSWKGEPGRYAEDLERLPALAAAAEVLGLRRTGTWVLPETPAMPEAESAGERLLDELAAWHVGRIGPIARVLADHGIRLGLEAIGVESFRTGRGMPYVVRLADLAARFGSLRRLGDNVGLLVDVFHAHAAGEDLEQTLSGGSAEVVWVHVADLPLGSEGDRRTIRDEDRGLPGESGLVDVQGALRLLARSGYDGPVTVEPLAGCRSLRGLSAEEIARRGIESLRQAWPHDLVPFSG